MLQALGVNAEAEIVYRTMLAAPASCITEIAAGLGLSDEEVRKRLDELAELSLLRPSWDVPGTVRPISPDIGLTALLARQQAEIARQQQLVEQSRSAMVTFVAQFAASESGRSQNSMEELQGLDGVRSKLEQLSALTRHEMVSFQPGVMSEQSRNACQPLDEASLRRGIRMRDVYMDSMRNDRPTRRYVEWTCERGAQARTVPTLPMRMIVFDREVAVIPLDPEHSRRGALVTRSKAAVTALLALFERVWERATPLGQPAASCAGGPTPQEKALLRMLTVGGKDEAAARSLGVSVRTVRRMMAELMERLGATSRFQACVNAAREGWV